MRSRIGAADEVDHRLAADLADDVPERRLEPGHRGIHHRPGIVLDLVEPEPQILDAERIAADEVAVGELVDERLDRELLPAERAVAPADDAVVGRDLDDEEVPPVGVDDERLHPLDRSAGGGLRGLNGLQR